MNNGDRFVAAFTFVVISIMLNILVYQTRDMEQGQEKRHLEIYGAIVENCSK